MSRIHYVALMMVTAGTLALEAAPARAQALDVIRWPTSTSHAELRGAPDNRFVGVSPYWGAWAAKFGCGVPYANLAALLRVPVATLAAADVISFEGNAGHPGESGGWESSKWSFSDASASITVVYDAVAGTSMPAGAVLASGSLGSTEYETYFGLPITTPPTVVSYILFDLPAGLDTRDPAFRVAVQGYPSGEGSPDPDTIGVFARGCGLLE